MSQNCLSDIFRKLVLASMIGVVSTLFVIGSVFFPMDGAHKLTQKGSDCYYGTSPIPRTCDDCLKIEECGFCYDTWADSAISGTCMKSNGTHGNCDGQNTLEYDWYVLLPKDTNS